MKWIKKNSGKLISGAFLFAGVFLLFQVGYPLVSFKIWEYQYIKNDEVLVSPQNNSRESVLGVSIEETSENFPAIISNLARREKADFEIFRLSIPKLKIDNEMVYVDSNNVNKGLAHLPGSALPGEKGNVFISGHSMLPQFMTGKAVFGNLQELKKGDEFEVTSDAGRFEYQVIGMKIVDPKDLSVIAPPDSQGRYVSLMTCVPPGLNTKRLVVLGKLN